MGLYINRQQHGNVYKNDSDIKTPNQGIFIRNHVSEMMKEQQKVNDALNRSFHGIKQLHEQQGNIQSDRWMKISSQLSMLKEMNRQHEKLEGDVVERLENLEKTIKKDHLSEEKFLEQFTNLKQTNQEIAARLGEYGQANEQIAQKMEEQAEIQKHMANQVSKQNESQGKLESRMENQEALMEKVIRQLDHFRSILFERTSFLSEKIEEGYKLTSTYVHQLMSGSDQPVQFYVANRKKEEDVE
ncbi:hypothetical protein [Virgibacillus ainsalahensis]